MVCLIRVLSFSCALASCPSALVFSALWLFEISFKRLHAGLSQSMLLTSRIVPNASTNPNSLSLLKIVSLRIKASLPCCALFWMALWTCRIESFSG